MDKTAYKIGGKIGASKTTAAVLALDSSKENINGTSSAGNSDFFYNSIGIYPARDNSCMILFTWNDVYNMVSEMVHIRMYLTTTHPNNIKRNDYWSFADENPFSDSMNTIAIFDITSEATEGDLYRTWVHNFGCYVIVDFQYYATADGKQYGAYVHSNYETTSSAVISSAPTLSYDGNNNQFTIGPSMVGKRILEFHNADRSYGYPTSINSEETLNEMYLTSLIDPMEGYDTPFQGYYYLKGEGAYHQGKRIIRWAPGTYTVGVTFGTNGNTANHSRISAAIDNAIDKVSEVMNEFGVYFTRISGTGNISITVDSHEALFGIDASTADYLYGGTWYVGSYVGGAIRSGYISLANDYYDYAPFVPYETVAVEELAQLMGAGYDQIDYPYNTLHTDFNYYNKPDYLTQKDKDILRLVYSDQVGYLDNYVTVALNLNIPKGCYLVSDNTTNGTYTCSGSFLKAGQTYEVRAFIVNSSGYVSATSDWITVTIPGELIDPWYWRSTIASGAPINITASEWNDFCDYINGVRSAKGMTSYSSFTTVIAKQTKISAAIVNHARTAISQISGHGTLPAAVSSGDPITASFFIKLAEAINVFASEG